MASTALPPLYPPWEVDGVIYMDGAINSDLPLQIAIARGATEIFALQICHHLVFRENPVGTQGIVTIGGQAIKALVNRVTELEIKVIANRRDICLHLISLWPSADPGPWNFVQADRLIADGRRAVERYLADNPIKVPWRDRWQRWLHCLPARQCTNFVLIEDADSEYPNAVIPFGGR